MIHLVNGASLLTALKSCYLIYTFADCGGQEGVIRLFNGSSVSDGEVEHCLDSTWTPVCGDDWEESEAAVACRHLGLVGEGIYI